MDRIRGDRRRGLRASCHGREPAGDGGAHGFRGLSPLRRGSPRSRFRHGDDYERTSGAVVNDAGSIAKVMLNADRPRRLDRSTLFTILIPVYDEEEMLLNLFDRLVKVVGEQPVSVEILLVNDGSRDASFALMCDFVRRDRRF